jgi:hypothetical protein
MMMKQQILILQMQVGMCWNHLYLSEKAVFEGPINNIDGVILHSIGLTLQGTRTNKSKKINSTSK